MDDVDDVKDKKGNIHWLSGVLLIVLDGAFFGANAAVSAPSLGLTIPIFTLLFSLIAFVFTGIGVFLVQKFTAGEDTGSALAKGFALGVLAGIPTPVAGTLGGGFVIAKAGIRAIRGKS